MRYRLSFVATLFVLLVGCASEPSAETAGAVSVPAGYRATVAASGLAGPTQMIHGPNGTVWVAQLDGAENAGTGQVLELDLATGERRVVLDQINKPTGIAIVGETLWIAAGRDLLRADIADGAAGPPETVLQSLPYNGRSNGTLTVTPDGLLLYETSGSRAGNTAAPDSGTLWELNPAEPARPRALARGLKGAYAHTFDAAGRLWSTEIGDDPVNGDAPPDELNLIVADADYGWPQCFGQREPALNYGGEAGYCQATAPPAALFPPSSTPTSLVESPWQPGALLVALWASAEGQVVLVVPAEGGSPGSVTPFLGGLQHPQHLLALDDGSLLVSDYGAGVIYRVAR